MELLFRALRALVRPVIAGLLLSGLALAGLFDAVDALVADRLLQRRGPREPSPAVAVVGVTDECVRKLGAWPWSRGVHARMVRRLERAGAAVVLWDMVLADPGTDAAGDRALEQALRAAKNVVLPIAAARAQSAIASEGPCYVEVHDAFSSLPSLDAAAAGIGHTHIQPDGDGVVRRLVPELRVSGRSYAAMPIVGVRQCGGHSPTPPTGPAGRLRLNYYGATGVPFEVLPYHLVLESGQIRDDAFRGRIVLVGGSIQALHDQHPTPLGRLYGIEVLATATSNLLQGDMLRSAGPLSLAALVLAVAMGAGLVSLVLGRKLAAIALLVLAAGLASESANLMSSAYLLLPYAAMALAGGAAWLLVTEQLLAGFISREEKEKQRLAEAVARLDGVERDYREQRAGEGLARLASVSPVPPELEHRARSLRLRGLLLRREELELETFLEREDLTRLPASELAQAATDLERRGREDLAEKALVALAQGGPVGLPVAETLARVRATIKRGAQDSPLLPIARRALGDGFQKVTLVGVGGMGFVVRALRLTDERWVAVKFLSPAYAHRSDFRKRFEREATILSRLEHPGVIEFLGASEGEPPHYMMAYFPSTGLGEVLVARKKLPLAEAARLLAPVARALEVAHAQDVVHRDVKPSNILVGLDGRVKLTDFGIAKAADLSAVTATGDSLGTPDYMSPEQLLSGAATVGPSSDVYSFALVLYESLTGDLPFGRGAPAFSSVSRNVVPPRERGAKIPAHLEELIMRALATRTADRTIRIGELAAALEACAVAEAAGASPAVPV